MMEIDFTGSVSNIAHLDTLLSAAYTGSLKLSPENITGMQYSTEQLFPPEHIMTNVLYCVEQFPIHVVST